MSPSNNMVMNGSSGANKFAMSGMKGGYGNNGGAIQS